MGTLLIDKLLHTAITQKASDLHLTVGAKPTLRLHGHMHPLNTKTLEQSDMVGLMKSITPERCQQELQEVGGTDFALPSASWAGFGWPCSSSVVALGWFFGGFRTSF